MNILAFMAHADDAAYFCGGTLLKYKALGHNIFIALTTGQEVPRGADQMDASVRYIGFEAGQVRDDMTSRAAALTAIRWANADIIITHALWDGDSDHAITAKLAADSLLVVGGKLHPADLPPTSKLPHLFYTDTIVGNSLANRPYFSNYRTNDQSFYLTPGVYSNDWYEPEAYVDISEYAEAKFAMLRDDALNASKIQSRLRGVQMGVKYSEAFTGHRIVGHVADYRLLP